MTRKEHFLKTIDDALLVKVERKLKVWFEVPELPKHECIVNPIENLPMKRDYYAKVYDDELRSIENPEIMIAGWRLV